MCIVGCKKKLLDTSFTVSVYIIYVYFLYSIIADMSDTKYNMPDSNHAGTIEYEKGGE